ncbi:MAG: glucose-1-phosphate cytidylyltransferase [Clostridia bacterium]|nr:glucose-1-phosphate cytidylyltransferase [Clostridia bacterium]
MKVVILAGGYGTRISEESQFKPKPMIEIGEHPILWHIMKEYSYYGFNEFIICAGYKQHVIKQFFADYYLHRSDVTFDFTKGRDPEILFNTSEPWKVTIVDTGLGTMTGGRLKRIAPYLDDDDFLMTYGDGVCSVNIKELVKFHKKHGKLATLTTVQPGGRFGTIDINPDESVTRFTEKRKEDGGWINGGYMVLNQKILDYIDDDYTVFEKEPLERVCREGELMAYRFDGFWQCMDTMRDKEYLESLIQTGKAPWTVWEKKYRKV